MVPFVASFEVDASLIMTVIIQLCSVAVVGGIGWARINQLDKEMVEVRTELREARIIREDLAVIKQQIIELNRLLRKEGEIH
jgi:5-bromo-4-chloroindolyl phosphate hydrolysis protein